MKSSYLKNTGTLAVAMVTLALNLSGQAEDFSATENWKDQAISPVANPLFFESPFISTEIRPLFVQHNISDKFIGGDVRVYAVQARYAVTDRLAIIATKDGYIDLNPKAVVPHHQGWADISAGVKYAIVDDSENNFIVTPGLKFEIPLGNERVFQGNGSGEVNAFVSAAKGWGKFHATASAGARIPIDFSKETASAHYSLQLDYFISRWFIPFVTGNGMTVLSETSGGPAFGGIEGFDLINFGASDASGFTQVALGAGFRSKLTKNLDLGFAYEKGVTSPKGLFDDRYTVDMILHF